MASPTPTIRISEGDRNRLTVLAGIEQRTPGAVIHRALAEYVAAHRAELSERFAAHQESHAAGDLEGIARVAGESLGRAIDALIDDLPE